MRVLAAGFAFVIGALAACASAVSLPACSAGSVVESLDAGSDASSDSAPGDGSVLGMHCPPSPLDPQGTCCPATFADECRSAGGFLEWCNGSVCQLHTPPGGALCEPPPPPTSGKFACAAVACNAGMVCFYTTPIADGCTAHYCAAPPSACAGTLTCACLLANYDASAIANCVLDAAGNPYVSFQQL